MATSIAFRGYSSSPVSTPPKSPEVGHDFSPTVSSNALSHSLNSTTNVFNVGGVGGVAKPSAKTNTPSDTVNVITKRPRKSKDVDAAPNVDGKEKKQRKPRAPRDPNAPPKPRKKPKTSDEANNVQNAQPASGHSYAARATTLPEQSAVRPSSTASQLGNHEAIQNSFLANARTTPRPASSGQVYDPVRSATIEPQTVQSPFNPPIASPLKLVSRPSASASPTIASIIHPPAANQNSIHTASSSLGNVTQTQHNASMPATALHPSTHRMHSPFAATSSSSAERKTSTSSTSHASDMDIDKPTTAEPPASTLTAKKTSSNGASPAPKQPRQKEAPPPPPLGSGLLSNDLFGGPAAFSNSTTGTETPTIVINIPLLGATNKYVNFAQEAEKKYGFNALYPRLAAHRERQARIAAASDALEKGAISRGGTNTNSADDMSLDNSEGESDREGGGAAGDGSGLDGVGGEVVKKRKKRTEGYDKEDDFIDDTELIWEEQAAASKDGFFVYSGPLVREGEKAAVERADGTVKRGRGRGRGSRGEGTSTRGSRGDGTSTRGSRGGGTGTSTRGSRGDGTSTRGTRGGRGSRGGATSGLSRGSPATTRGGSTTGSRGSGAVRKPRASNPDGEAVTEYAREKAERGEREMISKARELDGWPEMGLGLGMKVVSQTGKDVRDRDTVMVGSGVSVMGQSEMSLGGGLVGPETWR